jgi:exopolyphosphatase/guanosine-5'-triphosphate,3'-diphosphate pyrophosphatase
LVGVAGTITTIAAVAHQIAPYDGARVHGASLTTDEIARTRRELSSKSLAERQRIPALDPRRADVIVAGVVLVERVLAWAGASSLWVSDRGVRWGLAIDALESESRG